MPSRVSIVVLGDIGRSPRMCYHALSFAQKGFSVDLIGYRDSQPLQILRNNSNIRLIGLMAPPGWFAVFPSVIGYFLKFLWTSLFLTIALLFLNGFPTLIIMQNPPGIPVMAVCWLAARIKRSLFIIDWHNYTWTILKDVIGDIGDKKDRLNDGGLANASGGHPRHHSSTSAGARTGTNSSSNIHSSSPQNSITSTNTTNAKKRSGGASTGVTGTNAAVKESISGSRGTRLGGGNRQRLILFARWWESYFGPKADLNFCVTHAMRADLLENWGVRAVTVYDRPPSWSFRRFTLKDKHSLFLKFAMDKMYTPFWMAANDAEEFAVEGTRFSYRDPGGQLQLRDNRPALLVSSTSWTPDEDFSILLDALNAYDSLLCNKAKDGPSLPKIVCVVTGKGPEKAQYLEKMSRLNLKNVEFLTPWLEAEDYPKLLACADLGVCLHTSTSGLDLPMKVVDMFGCGLPVLALNFRCIDELVKENENGMLFDNFEGLCEQLVQLLKGFPKESKKLSVLRQNLSESPLVFWEDNWDATVYPLVQQ